MNCCTVLQYKSNNVIILLPFSDDWSSNKSIKCIFTKQGLHFLMISYSDKVRDLLSSQGCLSTLLQRYDYSTNIQQVDKDTEVFNQRSAIKRYNRRFTIAWKVTKNEFGCVNKAGPEIMFAYAHDVTSGYCIIFTNSGCTISRVSC